MSAWGTALFSDDTAADIRDNYRQLIGDGLSGPQATDALIKDWGEVLADPDEASVFWLALATTQWKCGRLEARAKTKALQIIDEGINLRRWMDDPKQLKKRAAVLARIREQLSSPQPTEMRIRKQYRNTCDWEVGEVIGYRLLSGGLFLFQVIGFHTDKGGTSPVCHMLDWSGMEAPSAEVLSMVRGKGPQFMIGRLTEKELPSERVKRLGIMLESNRQPGGYSVFLWSLFDQQLRELLGVE